jgi:hypothetical protein
MPFKAMSEKNTSKKQNKRRLAPEPLDTDRKQVEAHLKLFKPRFPFLKSINIL